ncbi:CBS domain-containing protein [Chitinophaga costaii]|uniref:CBS domain-containing protein n=1 Tax=Chitinophaga costaii TaxID=1335309 RepID=A0A1C4CE20_9BACT|nr:CBS domain-containing protein [Chitinophaga costaii]PUZ27125.1 CBS domain-containing protein [Chitinophaga costaii]SCC17349.1 CBS domain-containing protein [Chitinophaga costaii]
MTTVKQILQVKGHAVYTIQPDNSVYQALEALVNYNVGALMVLDAGGHFLGVFSERDYARRVVLKGRNSRETFIHDIMSEHPISVREEDTLEHCMQLMTDKHIRHLPVVDAQQRLVGLVSIGDLVKQIMREQQHTIQNLEKYISGAYHG